MREMRQLVLHRSHVAQTRVLAFAIVSLFDERKDVLAGLGMCRPVVVSDQFVLQCREETLGHRAVAAGHLASLCRETPQHENAKTPFEAVTYPRAPSVAMYEAKPGSPPALDCPVGFPVVPSKRRRINALTMKLEPHAPYPDGELPVSDVHLTVPVARSIARA